MYCELVSDLSVIAALHNPSISWLRLILPPITPFVLIKRPPMSSCNPVRSKEFKKLFNAL